MSVAVSVSVNVSGWERQRQRAGAGAERGRTEEPQRAPAGVPGGAYGGLPGRGCVAVGARPCCGGARLWSGGPRLPPGGPRLPPVPASSAPGAGAARSGASPGRRRGGPAGSPWPWRGAAGGARTSGPPWGAARPRPRCSRLSEAAPRRLPPPPRCPAGPRWGLGGQKGAGGGRGAATPPVLGWSRGAAVGLGPVGEGRRSLLFVLSRKKSSAGAVWIRPCSCHQDRRLPHLQRTALGGSRFTPWSRGGREL